jgi:hypothetical protein
MNKKTADRLRSNPHYKLSPKQKLELEAFERDEEKNFPVITFGKLPIHEGIQKKAV